MRVLVCGGRDYGDASTLWDELDTLRRRYGDDLVIIQGGARGADQMAREWCASRKAPCINFEADWKSYGRAAGPIRNALMVEDGKPDLVVAFPGGAGTANMISVAKYAGIKVRTVR